MTVIATIISDQCIAFATDSFITEPSGDGNHKIKESRQSKIVGFQNLRAAACYWGLAKYGKWDTYSWLRDQVKISSQISTLQEFATHLHNALSNEFSKLNFYHELDKGIGIHLAGYEYLDGYWIPELFVCTNYADTSYKNLCCLHLTRETYINVAKDKPSRQQPLSINQGSDLQERKYVNEWLKSGFMTFNNGDPIQFNPIAETVLNSAKHLAAIKKLRIRDVEFYRSLVKRPIEIVSAMQRDFCKKGTRLVGGRIHDVTITPDGQFESKSGDNKFH